MMTREFKGGLGPQVDWERKEKRATTRAFGEYGHSVRRQTKRGPRAGRIDYDDDDDCLKETSSDDPGRNNAWNQFDPMDYHARGW